MGDRGLQRDGKRAGEKQKANEDESSLREHIEKTVGNVTGENRGGIGTATEAHSETHGIATEDRRKKERGEKSAGIALGAGGEIELRASGVDDHAPFGDSGKMGQKVAHENGEEACDGDAVNGFE